MCATEWAKRRLGWFRQHWPSIALAIVVLGLTVQTIQNWSDAARLRRQVADIAARTAELQAAQARDLALVSRFRVGD